MSVGALLIMKQLSYPILSYPRYCTTLGEAGGGAALNEVDLRPEVQLLTLLYKFIYYF